MIRNPGHTMTRHQQLQTETCAGNFTPMRKCTGECKRKRSVGQFKGASTVCIRCKRRAV